MVMFKEMRRKEKKMSEEEIIELLKSGEEGVLATIGSDNYPYALPLNYAYHDNGIYFHCATSGHKIDNINNNAKVSFCVIKDTQVVSEKFSTKFKSAVLFGTAREMLGAEKKEGLMILVRRLSSAHIKAGEKYIKDAMDKTKVFKIDIEHKSGKVAK
jgi:nitroimidazol reductase NimA-like FMN-containing flavoprotein (pyridoxamine 5'-phosphate oxidase superfamily)